MNDDDVIDPSEYDDVIVFDYVPEIIAIHDNEKDAWIYNVVLYQDHDKTAYRIRSNLFYKNKEDAIMDANGVIELLGYSLDTKIMISCYRVEGEDVIEEPIMFDGTDFFPYEGDEDEMDDEFIQEQDPETTE